MASSRSQRPVKNSMVLVQTTQTYQPDYIGQHLQGYATAAGWAYSHVQQIADSQSFLLSVSGSGNVEYLRDLAGGISGARIHVFDVAGQAPVLVDAKCSTNCPHWALVGTGRPFMSVALDAVSRGYLTPEASMQGTTSFWVIYHVVEFRSIVVTNLSKQLQDDGCKKGNKEISQLMRGVGTVVRIDWKLKDKKTTAIVHFNTHNEAKRAISEYNGRSWMGRELQLRPDRNMVSPNAAAAVGSSAPAAAAAAVASASGPAIANGSNWGR